MRALLALLATLLALASGARASEPTVDERLVRLRSEQAALQARADGEGRLGLLAPLRTAGLLADALAIRLPLDSGRTLDTLPAPRRQAYAALAALADVLEEAMRRPGEGSRTLARQAGDRAAKALDGLAPTDDLPLVLQVTPRVVPPRRDGGDLLLVPPNVEAPPADSRLTIHFAAPTGREPPAPVIPLYAPAWATAAGPDQPVEIEIAGVRLKSDSEPPTLAVGDWRGEATIAPERLHFMVPRNAFGLSATRSALATATLALRRDGRVMTFELPFLVLPDRPGSVALDQRVRSMAPESNTLMSPEIVVRGAAGETRSVRRCFDPPPGWHFDKANRRVVIVERLGWLEDLSDPTLNGGTVEFASNERADQICLVVQAKPVTAAARTATIGRFEATLTREEAQERTANSGVRALDWREPLRLPIVPDAAERRLYVHLFDEVDRTFAEFPDSLPFVRLKRDGDTLVLQADPTAEP
ncbi:MAG: hypothetical protein JSS04_09585 [Proteobacteria bacterium]|nr:hypothetical protein [Pseudomonadota bacterium]